MSLRVRDVEDAFLTKLGAERDASGEHVYFYHRHEDSEFTVGKLWHSWRGALDDSQIGMLARKLLLRKREFEDWVTCTMGNEAMVRAWQECLSRQ